MSDPTVVPAPSGPSPSGPAFKSKLECFLALRTYLIIPPRHRFAHTVCHIAHTHTHACQPTDSLTSAWSRAQPPPSPIDPCPTSELRVGQHFCTTSQTYNMNKTVLTYCSPSPSHPFLHGRARVAQLTLPVSDMDLRLCTGVRCITEDFAIAGALPH